MTVVDLSEMVQVGKQVGRCAEGRVFNHRGDSPTSADGITLAAAGPLVVRPPSVRPFLAAALAARWAALVFDAYATCRIYLGEQFSGDWFHRNLVADVVLGIG